MKNFTTLFTVAIAVLFFSSCASFRSKSYDYIYINKQGVVQKPVVAELDVNEQKAQLNHTYSNMTVEEAKESAMVELINANKCDLLVHPMFSIEATGKIPFSSKWASIKIDLSGYPATYKNMKTFEPKDTANFLVNAQINNDKNKPMESIKENKPKTGKIILGVVLGITLLGLIL